MNTTSIALGFLTLVIVVWTSLIALYRRPLQRLWREPVLRRPIVIIESDDWGPGPPEHADALSALIERLTAHRDATGRAAVMTIGAILAIPDNAAMRKEGFQRYLRTTLLDSSAAGVRNALIQGRDRGVLALHLHGFEHLWPPALLQAIARDDQVRDWAMSRSGFETECLPSELQSRWVDGSTRPSRPLADTAIDTAVADEIETFKACFGEPPCVAVPPTFVWTESVERAWAAHGVSVIVTPGRRLTGRDADGQAGRIDRQIHNGAKAESGVTYLVRDLYFEPLLGHTAEQALIGVQMQSRLGRPSLLETHRFNFVQDALNSQRSLRELDDFLSGVRQHLPEVRFMSAMELAVHYAQPDREWIESNVFVRLRIFIRRAATISRLRKLAWLTGLALPVALFQLLSGFALLRLKL